MKSANSSARDAATDTRTCIASTTGANPQLPAQRGVDRELGAVAAGLGAAIRAERIRQRSTLSRVAAAAGLSVSAIHAAESGRVASLETYVRVARALRLTAQFEVVDQRRRNSGRQEDPVHAAMGELEAGHLGKLGFRIGLDEPFQHFQFAGRGDLLAWSIETGALLHVENRTQLPNLQAVFGAFNAKRAYLGREFAPRAGLKTWRSETHVLVALWSAEVLRELRLHRASFEALCPDSADAFNRWWNGEPFEAGRRSSLVVFDPLEGRRDRPRWIGLTDAVGARARYRDYADALAALKAAGLA